VTQSYRLEGADIAAGAPYTAKITGLTTGVPYYVRVSAGNSQGFGQAAFTDPPFLQPFEKPTAPTDVNLAVTSGTMLTVSFDEPLNKGGDTIQSYIVQWDTNSQFRTDGGLPHEGRTVLDASLHNSYTITSLTSGSNYFVRVVAVNTAGESPFAISSPAFAAPVDKEPGRPHSILATTGAQTGEIDLQWLHPSIPWHTIPCGGKASSPASCPSESGQSNPSSNGGRAIFEYVVSYNERADFLGLDAGSVSTSSTQYTLKNLIPGRKYYIRILARNAMGSSQYCQYEDPNCNIPTAVVEGVAKV